MTPGYSYRLITPITEYTEKSIGRSCTLEKNTKDWAFIKNTMIDLIKIVCFKAQKRKEKELKSILLNHDISKWIPITRIEWMVYLFCRRSKKLASYVNV